VNPIAGIGGRVGLKGSDGEATLALALERGATPLSSERARRALSALAARATGVSVLAAPEPMGAALAREAGFEVETTGPVTEGPTSAADTRAAAAEMLRRGVDLLLFAGGDGTARDIYDAIGDGLPLLGIPAGVKMHSGVFAATPDAAARAAEAYLRASGPVQLREVDIADVDEEALRADRLATRLYGSARVPHAPRLMLGAKAPSRSSPDGALTALCREIAQEMQPGCLYLLGPGTTTAAVLLELGLRGTLLGVDAVLDGRLVAADLDEAGLLAALGRGGSVELITGLVGGQGALFGRGNRQLSPAVLRALGRERIRIISAADKLLALDPPTLRVDTGDDELDLTLSGYVRVHVAPGRTIVMNVST
jgi:predicted polyphosphate/ATP-dependent NAD kinase